jgi:hypothetical protein
MENIWHGFLEGTSFRFVLFWLLRTLAVLTFIFGAFFWIGSLVQILQRLSLGLLIGGFLFLGFYIIALYALGRTLWKRARDIRNLPANEFPIFDIYAAVVRLIGEISAILLGFIGVGGMFLILGAGRLALDIFGFLILPLLPLFRPYSLMDPLGTITAGLGVFVIYTISAILILLGSYFLAELVTMLKRIFQNTQALQEGKPALN